VIAFFVYFSDRFLPFHDKKWGMQIADLASLCFSPLHLLSPSLSINLLSFVPYPSIDLKKLPLFSPA